MLDIRGKGEWDFTRFMSSLAATIVKWTLDQTMAKVKK